MVDMVPNLSLPPARPEIMFVADRSGGLKQASESLPGEVKFKIRSFESVHSFPWPESRSHDTDSLNEAMAHVEHFTADYGGTETHDAIKTAIDNRFADVDCEVLLFSDGNIWRRHELFGYLNDTVGNSIRVFSLGIGDGVSSGLIEGSARAGKGFAQTVGEREKLEKKMARLGVQFHMVWCCRGRRTNS